VALVAPLVTQLDHLAVRGIPRREPKLKWALHGSKFLRDDEKRAKSSGRKLGEKRFNGGAIKSPSARRARVLRSGSQPVPHQDLPELRHGVLPLLRSQRVRSVLERR
jgi:hypothetical protein